MKGEKDIKAKLERKRDFRIGFLCGAVAAGIIAGILLAFLAF